MTEVGTWSGGNWTGGGIFYGTVFRFTDGGQGANTHTWPMDVDGRYAVYVRWSAASNRNATADYTVHHADGTTTITHNQQTDGGVWKPLGVYDLESAATHKVVLADTGAGYTIADAILLVPMEIESLLVSADAVKLVANDAEDVLTIHADHLGAPQKMTDDTRTVVWDAAFTPFGEEDSIIGAETNNWRFPGQYADDESGLSYNWHRTYDPAIGRYLQSDPIGLGDGLNTYAYAHGNPIMYVDPMGLAICTYSITKHTLTCSSLLRPGETAQLGPEGVASGKEGKCRNNPDCADEKDVGPIQPGVYEMERSDKFGGSYWLKKGFIDRHLSQN